LLKFRTQKTSSVGDRPIHPMSSLDETKHALWSGAHIRVDTPNIDPKDGSVDRGFCTIRKTDVTTTLHASRGTQGPPWAHQGRVGRPHLVTLGPLASINMITCIFLFGLHPLLPLVLTFPSSTLNV
jgi:hypothetical protein